MPPGVKFPGEEIVRAALALVREQGGYAPCPRRRQGAWLRGCRAAHPLRKHRAVHSYARRAERAERVRSGTGLQNAVRHLSDPHRSRGCVCGISPAASAAVDKRGKLCQNEEKHRGGLSLERSRARYRIALTGPDMSGNSGSDAAARRGENAASFGYARYLGGDLFAACARRTGHRRVRGLCARAGRLADRNGG